MGIRCIGATGIFYWFNLYKSIIYRIILIFLLHIEFWVGKNEQLKGQVHREGTLEWPVKAEIRHLAESQSLRLQKRQRSHKAESL